MLSKLIMKQICDSIAWNLIVIFYFLFDLFNWYNDVNAARERYTFCII